MTDQPDNPPAFPYPSKPRGYGQSSDSGQHYVIYGGQPGMTLRDYFAAHAPLTFADAVEHWRGKGESTSYEQVMKTLAAMRMAYADAMLRARQP